MCLNKYVIQNGIDRPQETTMSDREKYAGILRMRYRCLYVMRNAAEQEKKQLKLAAFSPAFNEDINTLKTWTEQAEGKLLGTFPNTAVGRKDARNLIDSIKNDEKSKFPDLP